MKAVLTLEQLHNRATITVEEASELLGIGRRQAYEAVQAGQIPSLRLGRRVLVPVPKLLALLGVEAAASAAVAS